MLFRTALFLHLEALHSSTIYEKRDFSPNVLARLWLFCEIPYCHLSVYGMVSLQQSNCCLPVYEFMESIIQLVVYQDRIQNPTAKFILYATFFSMQGLRDLSILLDSKFWMDSKACCMYNK